MEHWVDRLNSQYWFEKFLYVLGVDGVCLFDRFCRLIRQRPVRWLVPQRSEPVVGAVISRRDVVEKFPKKQITVAQFTERCPSSVTHNLEWED